MRARRHRARSRRATAIEALRAPFRRELARRLYHALTAPDGIDETTPGVSAVKRLEQARAEIVDACDGFLAREAIRASLTPDERREILRGMVLTRAVDNRLKQLFMGGEVRWGDTAFQGKGFRSLGQEAIYAGGIRLRRGAAHRRPDGTWSGDVVAPVIRDLGVDAGHAARRRGGAAGAERADGQGRSADVRQGPAHRRLGVGRAAGRGAAVDRVAEHRRPGDGLLARGLGPRRAVVHRRGRLVARRVARGDQPVRRRASCRRSSACRTTRPRSRRRCRENSAVRVFADKAAGYGMPGHHDRRHRSRCDRGGVHLGGRSRARRARAGADRAGRRCACAATRITTTCSISARKRRRRGSIRRCTTAATPIASATSSGASAIRSRATRRGSKPTSVITRGELDDMKREAEAIVERQARAVIDAPWPEPAEAGVGVFKDEAPRTRIEVLDPRVAARAVDPTRDAAAARARPAVRQEGQHVSRSGDARRRRRAARRPARVRLRRGRRRPVRQRVPAAAAAARRSSAIASSTRRWPRARCSACASAPRSPGSGRSARCSSTTSSPPASISWSTTPRRSATAGAATCRWSCACRGAACATPARITARTPSRGSTARRG